MAMGWLWVRTSSLCCWQPQGPPALTSVLQWHQLGPPSCGGWGARAGSWAGPCHPWWLQGYLLKGRCGGTSWPPLAVAECCGRWGPRVTGAGWGLAGAMPPLCHHPRELAGFLCK